MREVLDKDPLYGEGHETTEERFYQTPFHWNMNEYHGRVLPKFVGEGARNQAGLGMRLAIPLVTRT